MKKFIDLQKKLGWEILIVFILSLLTELVIYRFFSKTDNLPAALEYKDIFIRLLVIAIIVYGRHFLDYIKDKKFSN